MNLGTSTSKKMMKTDKTWHLLSKDTKKQMLGTYDEYIRAQEKKHPKRFEQEGGEEE